MGWNHQAERFRGIFLLKIVTILVVMGGRSNGELFDLRTFPKQQPFTFCNVWPDANLALKQTKPCGGFSIGNLLPKKFVFGTDYALKINKCQRFRRTMFLLQEVSSHWQKYVTSCGPWQTAGSRWCEGPGIVGICGAPPTPGENGQSHREYQAALIYGKEGVTQITQERYEADLSMLGVLIKSLLSLPHYEARVQHSVTRSKPMNRKLTLCWGDTWSTLTCWKLWK